ncbi:glycosyltransferase family 2 protein [Chryseobacterium sp.]|uniref:glycosyltransferase family 2 protein n=1 Tax=Chryseobacterium sp. TaxID=1871047 RepID=UPI0011C712EA|nr:glycosyltransferase family A protein [Chryseobacterium sp.]TXF77218.1 glycosyltransferase family 2 protein [Chryseobacterium sp.]
MNDLVSVIIPYYHCENYISETLECIKNQTYHKTEIIIVNDGSNPDFLDKIRETSGLRNLKIIHQQNLGQSEARNNGVRNSTGNYLLFLDCDDKILPDFIERTLKILQSDKEIRIVYSKGRYFEAREGEWVLPEFEKRSFLMENCIPITALIYREDFEKAGGFDKNLTFFEDWDLWISIIENGGKVHRIDDFLFLYRIQNAQKSLSDRFKNDAELLGDNYFKIYSKHYNFYKENGIGFQRLFAALRENHKYRSKYYSVWYRKLIYKCFKPKKYQSIYPNLKQ